MTQISRAVHLVTLGSYRMLLTGLEITFVYTFQPPHRTKSYDPNNHMYSIINELNQVYYWKSFFIRTFELWNALPSGTKLKQFIHSPLSRLASVASVYLSVHPFVLRGKIHGVRDIIFYINSFIYFF